MAHAHLLRRTATRALEGAVSVLSVLFFFGAILALLNLFFPAGASLGELLRSGASGPLMAATSSSGQELVAEGLMSRSLAVLARTHHDVRTRRGDSIAWKSAETGMSLNAEDAVQTSRRSSAVISFDDRNRLDLGPNSLVIIKNAPSSGALAARRRSSMVMSEGEIHGALDPTTGGDLDIEVALPNGTARVGPAVRGSDFRIQVNPDKSSTVIVERGAAEVSANGITVRVGERQYTRVALTGAPEAPQELLAAPVHVSPRPGEAFAFREVRPSVVFRWKPVVGVDAYRIIIASDEKFQTIVHDGTTTESRFTHGNLRAGRYWWQVAGLCVGGECTFRQTGNFRVIQDHGLPLLDVQFPDDTVASDHVVLEGKAEAGVRVFIAGSEVKVDKAGHFSHRVDLTPGLNVVVVEAVDRIGNVSYRSKILNAKF